MEKPREFEFKEFAERLRADFTTIMATGLQEFEEQAIVSQFNDQGIRKAVQQFRKRFDKSLRLGIDKIEKLFRVP